MDEYFYIDIINKKIDAFNNAVNGLSEFPLEQFYSVFSFEERKRLYFFRGLYKKIDFIVENNNQAPMIYSKIITKEERKKAFSKEEAKKVYDICEKNEELSVYSVNIISFLSSSDKNDSLNNMDEGEFSFIDVDNLKLSINEKKDFIRILFKIIERQEKTPFYFRNHINSLFGNDKEDNIELFNLIMDNFKDHYYNISAGFFDDLLEHIDQAYIKDASIRVIDYIHDLEYSLEGKNNFFNLYISSLIERLKYEDRYDMLKLLLDKRIFKNYHHVDFLFKLFDNEDREKVFDLFINYSKREDIQYINDFNISEVLLEIEENKRIDFFFNKYMSNYFEFDIINVVRRMQKNLALKIFDKYIEKIQESDIKKEYKDEFLKNCIEKIFGYDTIHVYDDSGLELNNINELVSKIYNVNLNNTRLFLNRFGYGAISFIESDNTKSILRLDEEKFSKLMNIFSKENTKFDKDTLNTVVNSLLQREFLFNDNGISSLILDINKMINNKDYITLKNKFIDISKAINIEKITNKSLDEFIEDIKNPEYDSKEQIKIIVNKYITYNRDEYVKKRLKTVYDELYVDFKYEKNYIKRELLKSSNFDFILELICTKVDRKDLNDVQNELLDDFSILSNIILFKQNPTEIELDIPDKNKYLRAFEDILDYLYDKDKLHLSGQHDNGKYVYYPKEVLNEQILDIFAELDYKNLNNLLSNDRVYKNLLNFLNKYKMLGWGFTFDDLSEKVDLSFDDASIAGIISHFELISKSRTLSEYLAKGNAYSSASSKYSYLMGVDNYNLYASNTGVNKACATKFKRLDDVPDLIRKMYSKETICVPPMDEIIELENGKKINVVIGNTKSMDNLTYGERTESCLRRFGAFDNFFMDALSNPNTYHIAMYNPDNNNFISRVSVICNGNSHYCNELRYSCDENYENEDLTEALSKATKLEIERSKQSPNKIGNFFITPDLAYEKYIDRLINVDVDMDKAMRGIKNNYSRENKMVLVSSSNENGYEPVTYGEENTSYYNTQRSKVEEYYGEKAARKVCQLNMINEVLSGKKLEDIEIVINNDIKYCAASSDWYFAIDKNNNTYSYIMENSNDNERAHAEIKKYTKNQGVIL